MWHQEEVYVRLYAKLSPLSVDQRMLTIRQLIKRDLVSQNIGDEALEQVTQCLLEKPFGAWYEKDFGHIRGLTRQTAMLMLQHYPEIQAFIPEFRAEAMRFSRSATLPRSQAFQAGVRCAAQYWLPIRIGPI